MGASTKAHTITASRDRTTYGQGFTAFKINHNLESEDFTAKVSEQMVDDPRSQLQSGRDQRSSLMT